MHCIVFTAYIALTVFACAAPTVDIEAETAAVRRRSEALVAAETAKDVGEGCRGPTGGSTSARGSR